MLLRVIDIETTGMEPPAEIIELGWQDVHASDGGGGNLDHEARGAVLFGCAKPCPPEVLAIHHILPRETDGKPPYSADLAIKLMQDWHGLKPAAYVAHNAKFEQAFLVGLPATRWICTYKAALRIWPNAPAHTNQTLLYWLGLHEEADEALRHPPHRAGPDAYVTAHILTRLLREASVEEMVQWTQEPPALPTCPIGKEWRGKPWAEVDTGFLQWMLNQATMENDLKFNARRELERRRTAAPAFTAAF